MIEGQSLPAIVDNTVYVGSRFEFMALDASTGEQRWLREMRGLINSSPAVAGDTVLRGFDGTRRCGAFDKDTGETRWTFPTGNYISSAPLVHNGFLFIGSGDQRMYALDAATGRKFWEFRTGELITSPPALHNGVLYFTSQGRQSVFGELPDGGGADAVSHPGDGFVRAAGDFARAGVYVFQQRYSHGEGGDTGDAWPVVAGEDLEDSVGAVGVADSDAAAAAGNEPGDGRRRTGLS